MVILGTLSDSYMINGDGTSISPLQIGAPCNNDYYSLGARSAVVFDKLYMFGGSGVNTSSRKVIVLPFLGTFSLFFKIARFDSCGFVELSVRLNVDFTWGHSTLSNGSEALICFGPNNPRYCNIFNGSTVVWTHPSNVKHLWAALGFYKGKPTAVGGQKDWWNQSVETKSETGWTSLRNFKE